MSRAQPADQHGANGINGDEQEAVQPLDPDLDSESDSVSSPSAETTSSSGSDSDSDLDSEPDAQPSPNSNTAHQINGNGTTAAAGDLRSRLARFLPQLADANRDLDSGEDARIDVVGEDEERYVEMDLGLGVLEERREGAGGEDGIVLPTSRGDGEDSDDEGSDEGEGGHVGAGAVLAALKGEPEGPKKRGIEEVD